MTGPTREDVERLRRALMEHEPVKGHRAAQEEAASMLAALRERLEVTEAERAEQWRRRREAEAARDTERAMNAIARDEVRAREAAAWEAGRQPILDRLRTSIQDIGSHEQLNLLNGGKMDLIVGHLRWHVDKAALDTSPFSSSQKEWCPFEDDCVDDRPDLDFVREDLRAEKARDEEISRRHFNEGWRLTSEMPDLEEDGWRDRAIYAERGHHQALRQWGELSTRLSAWHETARLLEKQLEAAERASQATFAPPPADDLRAALEAAERFISGFEGDETQDGIADLLSKIRAGLEASAMADCACFSAGHEAGERDGKAAGTAQQGKA